jgi:hypothetical protein
VVKSTAQELLDGVIKSALVPALKAEGYRKAGHTFRKAGQRCTLVVNVQASLSSTRETLKFTVNLGAFYPELNEVMQRGSWAGPGASGPSEAQCQIRERLGPLTPSARDVWWELRVGSSPLAVATEVMEALRDHGLPWLRSMTDLDVARDYTVKRGQAVEAAAFSILAGQRVEARDLIADFLASRPQATAVRAWARQLGLLE